MKEGFPHLLTPPFYTVLGFLAKQVLWKCEV